MELAFLLRSDGVVDIALPAEWSGLEQALNDSLGTRAPRGDDSPAPSTYWLDRTLARIRRNDGSPAELSSGNMSTISLADGQLIVSADYETFEEVRLPIVQAVELLHRWRTEAILTASRLPTAYDDAYPTCERAYASLRIFSSELEPEAIDSLLGGEHSTGYRIGDPISSRSGGLRTTNAWILSSEKHVDSRDLSRHIDWLLDSVDLDELVALGPERSASMDIFCFWESKSGHGGPRLHPGLMTRLGRLNLEIGFDVYGPA